MFGQWLKRGGASQKRKMFDRSAEVDGISRERIANHMRKGSESEYSLEEKEVLKKGRDLLAMFKSSQKVSCALCERAACEGAARNAMSANKAMRAYRSARIASTVEV